MAYVNQKGGFHKKLSVIQNGTHESLTVLKNSFLKKTENFALQITDFYINKVPEITRDTEPFIKIKQFGHYGAIESEDQWQPHITRDFREFYPRKCYTVVELVRQLQEFLHRFSYLILTRGYTTTEVELDGSLTNSPDLETFGVEWRTGLAQQQVTTNYSATQLFLKDGAYVNFGYKNLFNEGRCVSVNVTKDNLLEFVLHPEFAESFYLRLSAKASVRLGRARAITDLTAMQITRHRSTNTIQCLDERSSIDIWATLPISTKMAALNSVETRDFILGRFPLAEEDAFKGTYSMTADGASNKTSVISTFSSGLQNLTKYNPAFESNHLLNGDIRQVHLRLHARYFEDGKFVSVPLECEDAIWVVNMLFSKKL